MGTSDGNESPCLERAAISRRHLLADIINQLVPEVKVFGAICLDYEIGGLNIHALETSAKMGAKMVWMPIHSSLNSRANMRKLPGAVSKVTALDTGCGKQTGAGNK